LNELRSIQTLASLRPSDRIVIFLGSNFSATAVTENAIEKNKAVLAALAPSEIQQRQLIAACEWFCGSKYPELQRYFPVMLKQLYDADLVEEDVFYSWATDYSRNEFSVEESMISIDTLESLKQAAQPFINWLQEAEEEGDDEEDDENDDEEEA
jgi:translation initiation factor 5